MVGWYTGGFEVVCLFFVEIVPVTDSRTVAVVVHAVVLVRIEELDVRVGGIVRMAGHLVMEVLMAAHHVVLMLIHGSETAAAVLLDASVRMSRMVRMVRHQIWRSVDVVAVHLRSNNKKEEKIEFRELMGARA